VERGAKHLGGGGREDDHEHLGADRDDDAVAERPQEDRVVEDRSIVVETDPPKAEAAGGRVTEAERDREHERDPHEEDHIREGWRQHHGAQHLLAVGEGPSEGERHPLRRNPVSASK
jgi:hypothetical protein